MDVDKTENRLSRDERAKLSLWLAQQRGRRQYRHAPPASASVSKIVKPLSAKFGAGVTAIHQNWETIAGRRFAKISRPVKITGGKDGRTLVIKAPGPAAALIMASSGQILDRLNSFLGYGHITRIKLIQGAMNPKPAAPNPTPSPRGLSPSEKASLQSGLEHIEDDALRQALEGLGKKTLAQTRQRPPHKHNK